ncbi:IclR family transcriptional regulator [Paeniglutamicibacter sp. MACA_103]|uniref:IclR family transcriptional regulator n=1 Tax=Paeniglutamicibacter sp. MACA_103 TaxID=3377337 RepID=UPI003893DD7B
MANAHPNQKRTAASTPPTPGTAVTARALALLGSFDSAHPKLTLSEMARRAHLPVATAHRLIAELLAWGALERAGQDYVIGHRLWQLGLLAPVNQNIAELAAPYMQDVLFVTQNVVNLFILDGNKVLLLERISGTRSGAPFLRVGEHLPLHASAAGKVMLAFGDQSLWDTASVAIEKLTEHTISSPQQLRSEVDKVRERGYATTSQEAGIGNYGIAVPIIAPDGSCRAALGVVTQERAAPVGSVVPVLRIAARSIARRVSLGRS